MAKIVLGLTLGIVLISGFSVLYQFFFGPVSDCEECSPLAHDVVASIHDDPSSWRNTPYDFINDKLGVDLWIASGASFMAPKGLKSNPEQWRTGPGLASREQRFVWTAYEEWRRHQNKTLTLSDVGRK